MLKKLIGPIKNFIKPSFGSSIKKRIQGLDELRGIAVLFVMIDHAQLLFFKAPKFPIFNSLGYYGVDIFFIVSGFLIAKILIKNRESKGYLRTFYIRRIFRIWPLMYVFVALGVVMSLYAPITNLEPFKVLPYYIIFAQNFLVPFGIGLPLPGTSPFWSLAIEEQFYLFLPVVIMISSKKVLPLAILSIFFISIILRYNLTTQHLGFYYTNITETYMRIHYLCLGVLFNFKNYKRLLAIAFSIWLFVNILSFSGNGILELPLSLLTVYLVFRSFINKPIFKSAMLAHFGKLCFGLYIIHYTVAKSLYYFTNGNELTMYQISSYLTAYFIISYILAYMSYNFFEIPIQNLRTRFETKKNKIIVQ